MQTIETRRFLKRPDEDGRFITVYGSQFYEEFFNANTKDMIEKMRTRFVMHDGSEIPDDFELYYYSINGLVIPCSLAHEPNDVTEADDECTIANEVDEEDEYFENLLKQADKEINSIYDEYNEEEDDC
jgi:hypothetical protein